MASKVQLAWPKEVTIAGPDSLAPLTAWHPSTAATKLAAAPGATAAIHHVPLSPFSECAPALRVLRVLGDCLEGDPGGPGGPGAPILVGPSTQRYVRSTECCIVTIGSPCQATPQRRWVARPPTTHVLCSSTEYQHYYYQHHHHHHPLRLVQASTAPAPAPAPPIHPL